MVQFGFKFRKHIFPYGSVYIYRHNILAEMATSDNIQVQRFTFLFCMLLVYRAEID